MERQIVTIKEIAEREGISERQAQRYCREGYKGHVLPAVRVGKSFQIAEHDYRAWRVLCGWEEAQPQVLPTEGRTPADPAASGSTNPAVPAFTERSATFPPWPMPACPGGPITNVPHPSSGNMPHPEACRIHAEDELRKLQQPPRGYPNE